MKSNELKKYVIGFLFGSCFVFLLGATGRWHSSNGHCQSSLSSVSETGEVYLAITNTATGKTVVHRFGEADFADNDAIIFDATSINKDRLLMDAP